MIVVIKTGGNVLREKMPEIIEDIKTLLSKHKIVLVHGGGTEVTKIASRMGKKQKFVVSPKGFRSRYTDRETVEIYMMVMAGKINKKIVTTFLSKNISCVGLSGIDGLLVQANRKKRIIIVDEKGRKRIVDGGYTGKIQKVNPNLLFFLLQKGYVPVIAPIALGEDYESLNVDGDRMAAYVAGALKADKLLLLTDVPGIILDEKPLRKINADDLKISLPKIGHGMITKAYSAIEALKLGVAETIISSGLVKNPVYSAMFHKCGTVISDE